MTRRGRFLWACALLGPAAVLAATIVKTGLNAFGDEFLSQLEPCETASEAQEYGVLRKRVNFDPPEVVVDGLRLCFQEGWVEDQSLPGHRYVWFSVRKRQKGFYLVLLEDPACRQDWSTQEFPKELGGPDLDMSLMSGSREHRGFRMHSTSVRHVYRLDSLDNLPDRIVFGRTDTGYRLSYAAP